MGECCRTPEPIRQPRDRLIEQPQEREHSDAESGTRDRLLPAGAPQPREGIVTARPRRRSRLRDLDGGSVSRANRARPEGRA